MKKVLLFCLLVFGLVPWTIGQTTLSVSISPNTSLFGDSVLADSSKAFDVIVTNTGLNPLNDSLTINIGTFDNGGALSTVQSVLIQAAMIDTGMMDTFPILHTFTVSAAAYNLGGNTIVIWPESNSADGDTIKGDIFIQDPLSIRDLFKRKTSTLSAFPNPVKDKMTLKSASGEKIEQVRILDALGHLIATYENQQTIRTRDLIPGVYIVEATTSSGFTDKFRILKQD